MTRDLLLRTWRSRRDVRENNSCNKNKLPDNTSSPSKKELPNSKTNNTSLRDSTQRKNNNSKKSSSKQRSYTSPPLARESRERSEEYYTAKKSKLRKNLMPTTHLLRVPSSMNTTKRTQSSMPMLKPKYTPVPTLSSSQEAKSERNRYQPPS
jgi:hypothetical protein